MRAGVGHGAMTKVLDQAFEFRTPERIIGFNGMATDCFGNRMLAQAQRIHLLTGGF